MLTARFEYLQARNFQTFLVHIQAVKYANGLFKNAPIVITHPRLQCDSGSLLRLRARSVLESTT
jgi:hypothetical protein